MLKSLLLKTNKFCFFLHDAKFEGMKKKRLIVSYQWSKNEFVLAELGRWKAIIKLQGL